MCDSNTQRGFTLTEILVSFLITAIASTGIISFFVGSMKSNTVSLNSVHLHQELRTLLDVMSRDIRRAGYWRNADGISKNMYMSEDNVLKIVENNCITYSYDDYKDSKSQANIVQHTDTAGFRLKNYTLKTRKKSSPCSSNRNWESISDRNFLKVTKLDFQLEQVCVNNNSPKHRKLQQADCKATKVKHSNMMSNPSDTFSVMYVVTITLSGELVANPEISVSNITETVAVRNIITS